MADIANGLYPRIELSSNPIRGLSAKTFQGLRSLIMLSPRCDDTTPPAGIFQDLTKLRTCTLHGEITTRRYFSQQCCAYRGLPKSPALKPTSRDFQCFNTLSISVIDSLCISRQAFTGTGITSALSDS
eukprot:751371-Hanusia_phi.AAC.3